MQGYCSNSPIRCSYASSCEVVNSENDVCPNCQMALITTGYESNYIDSLKRLLVRIIVAIGMLVTIFLFFYFRQWQKF